ncbi:MAG: bifunctional (p)ppGpp synthetase/guanosine-3',5'-bis(diphosphate) 3'-pyrophosphohydrolase [Chlorobi bacterium]|nr:bifunctional (p)ppGpp synthetase/guanosine-3',5'-bis(diphosphate) 3'-pyrophosphohydrolase [Chlorobiota bacterium]
MLDRSPKYNQSFLTKSELTEKLMDVIGSVELNRINSAWEMAQNVHQFQQRNDGTPYFWHPSRVAKILLGELGITDSDLICAALLHDVLEDSDILTPKVLAFNFGDYVGDIVETLTKEIGIKDGPLREKIDQEYIERLQNSSEDCRIVKLADRLDNLRCIQFNLKRDPYKYVKETIDHYVPMAEEPTNPHLKYLLKEIRKEQNRFFG